MDYASHTWTAEHASAGLKGMIERLEVSSRTSFPSIATLRGTTLWERQEYANERNWYRPASTARTRVRCI